MSALKLSWPVVLLTSILTQSPCLADDAPSQGRGRFWLSGGLANIQSNATYNGLRLATGGDFYLGSSDWFFGAHASIISSGERPDNAGSAVGNIVRFSLIPSLGNFLISRSCWLRGGIGFSIINSAASGFATKIKSTAQAQIGYQFALNQRQSLGLELGYEFTARAAGADIPITQILNCLSDNCTSGVAPKAHIITAGAVMAFD
jgi:hypothetical protein